MWKLLFSLETGVQKSHCEPGGAEGVSGLEHSWPHAAESPWPHVCAGDSPAALALCRFVVMTFKSLTSLFLMENNETKKPQKQPYNH